MIQITALIGVIGGLLTLLSIVMTVGGLFRHSVRFIKWGILSTVFGFFIFNVAANFLGL